MSVVENLKGEVVGKWYIKEKVPVSPIGSGGTFSVGYFVTNNESPSDDKEYFMKVINLERALGSGIEKIQQITADFIFEESILNICKDNKLSRVMFPIDSGKDELQHLLTKQPFNNIHYIVFEKALGDIRTLSNGFQDINMLTSLSALHHAAVGLKQIHSKKIAHQDLKPSNVLQAEDSTHKIADFGRAWSPGISANHDDNEIAGDHNYAPIEQFLGYEYKDTALRRYGTDLYQLGQLILFFFNEVPLTAYYHAYLKRIGFVMNRTEDLFPQALPYLEVAFQELAESLYKKIIALSPRENNPYIKELAEQIKLFFIELCSPNPENRGYNKAYVQGKYYTFLEKIISKLDLIIRKYEMSVI